MDNVWPWECDRDGAPNARLNFNSILQQVFVLWIPVDDVNGPNSLNRFQIGGHF